MTEHLRRKHFFEEIPDVARRTELISRCALDDTDRRILILRYAEQKDFGFIADKIGLSYPAVIKRHKKALIMLQRLATERTKQV